ncbi:glucuronate isomerase [Balneolaceae bacterium ANBcel3]|nr:glucuronate isomerase [Balneolaceae bacterium ANBcel3]
MKPFIHDDFLLQSDTAKKLYHEYARELPIIDFHNHLSPKEVCENTMYENITHVWLQGDHYKWRAMRAAGVEEDFITGKASDKDKFLAWAKTVPLTLKNPLYHWTHLELKRYFGIDERLSEENAEKIWDQTCEMLRSPEFSSRELLKKQSVELIGTTDDAADSLEYHEKYRKENSDSTTPVMLPTFRPDKAMAVEDSASFGRYVRMISEMSGVAITDYPSYVKALKQRHDMFSSLGCRASDHGMEELYAEKVDEEQLNRLFRKVQEGNELTADEVAVLKSGLMYAFAAMDAEKDMVFQMHLGAIRNTNSRAFREIGADIGCDSIGDAPVARPLARFLDQMESKGALPRTILYNLNPADNAVIATMAGNFMGHGIPGRIQYGPAWWFHDQKEGMEEQLQTLSNMGLLSHFVGMVTDSRSFLSFPRHEYYRRILCNMLGSDVESGILPADEPLIGSLVQRLCYYNAKAYFKG